MTSSERSSLARRRERSFSRARRIYEQRLLRADRVKETPPKQLAGKTFGAPPTPPDTAVSLLRKQWPRGRRQLACKWGFRGVPTRAAAKRPDRRGSHYRAGLFSAPGPPGLPVLATLIFISRDLRLTYYLFRRDALTKNSGHRDRVYQGSRRSDQKIMMIIAFATRDHDQIWLVPRSTTMPIEYYKLTFSQGAACGACIPFALRFRRTPCCWGGPRAQRGRFQ